VPVSVYYTVTWLLYPFHKEVTMKKEYTKSEFAKLTNGQKKAIERFEIPIIPDPPPEPEPPPDIPIAG